MTYAVRFDSFHQEDAAAALENMQDAEFFGRVLKVNVAKPNALRSKASKFLLCRYVEGRL